MRGCESTPLGPQQQQCQKGCQLLLGSSTLSCPLSCPDGFHYIEQNPGATASEIVGRCIPNCSVGMTNTGETFSCAAISSCSAPVQTSKTPEATLKVQNASFLPEKQKMTDETCVHPTNLAGINRFAASLKTRKESFGYCAREVKNLLNVLFNKKASGANAEVWDLNFIRERWNEPNRTCSYREISPQDPKNFDLRVLTAHGRQYLSPSGWIAYGHVEIFYEGTWYSDHKQARSYLVYPLRNDNAHKFRTVSPLKVLTAGEQMFTAMKQYRYGVDCSSP